MPLPCRVITVRGCVPVWLAALPLLLLSAGCRPRNAQSAPAPPPPPPVTVSHPIEREVVEWDEYFGHLDAVDSVDVRARVTGFIVSAPLKEGAIVKKGDLLFEIDVRPFQAELDARKADQARAEAQLYLANVEYKRTQGLLTEQAAPPIEFQTAESNQSQAVANVAAAKAAVEAAQLNVEWCHVVAPVAGRVSRMVVTPGNLISGGTGASTLLTTIQSLDPIYCYFEVDEQSVLKYQHLAREKKIVRILEYTTPCYLALDDEHDFSYQGTINFVDNHLDANTGTMIVRGVFPNPNQWLTPGLFARVRVPGSDRYRALLVPDVAVATNQSQKLLLVVGPDDTIVPHPVKLGALFGQLRAIQEGITPQDRVVVEGQMQARPGTKVAPHEAPIRLEPEQLGGAQQPASSRPASAPATQSSAATLQRSVLSSQFSVLSFEHPALPTAEDRP